MDNDTLDKLRDLAAEQAKKVTQSPAPVGVCPSCGRCPHCGRGGYYGQPYPAWPQPHYWYGYNS